MQISRYFLAFFLKHQMAHLLLKYAFQAAAAFNSKLRKGENKMRKLAIAFAMILGLNMVSSIVNLSVPMSYAQENPEPEPEKPEKPSE